MLAAISRLAIEQGRLGVDGAAVAAAGAAVGLTSDAVAESLEHLVDEGLVDGMSYAGPSGRSPETFEGVVTLAGLLTHLEASRPGLEGIRQAALAAVVNAADHEIEREEIARAAGVEPLVVEAVLSPYEGEGLAVERLLGGQVVYRATSRGIRRHIR